MTEILSDEAVAFVTDLIRRFRPRQDSLRVHDSGPPANPRPRPTGLSAALTVVSGSLSMKLASPGDAGLGLVGMAERAALHYGTVQRRPRTGRPRP